MLLSYGEHFHLLNSLSLVLLFMFSKPLIIVCLSLVINFVRVKPLSKFLENVFCRLVI